MNHSPNFILYFLFVIGRELHFALYDKKNRRHIKNYKYFIICNFTDVNIFVWLFIIYLPEIHKGEDRFFFSESNFPGTINTEKKYMYT